MPDPLTESVAPSGPDPADNAASALRIDLEQQLRDVQLPDHVDWWPPAPGWWLLAAAVIALFLFTGLSALNRARHRRPDAPRRNRLDQIYADWTESGQAASYYQQISQQLRIAALKHTLAEPPTRLSSHAWVDWLESNANHRFSDMTRRVLAQSCYEREPLPPTPEIHADICRWSERFELARTNARRSSKTVHHDGVSHA